jgi:hypothetical protein
LYRDVTTTADHLEHVEMVYRKGLGGFGEFRGVSDRSRWFS